MIIRPLVANDRPGWEPLWQGYLQFYKASIAPEVTDLTFARLTGGTEPMGGFVAVDDSGKIAGIVHWITHRSCWTAGDYCYLQDLFVASDRRATGIGRDLIEIGLRQCAVARLLTGILAHARDQYRSDDVVRPHRRSPGLRAISQDLLTSRAYLLSSRDIVCVAE